MFRSVNSNAEITDVLLLIYINTYGFLLYAYFEIEKHYKKKRPVPNMYIISIYFSNRSYRASMGYTYIYILITSHDNDRDISVSIIVKYTDGISSLTLCG